jgi:hypothetical protein
MTGKPQSDSVHAQTVPFALAIQSLDASRHSPIGESPSTSAKVGRRLGSPIQWGFVWLPARHRRWQAAYWMSLGEMRGVLIKSAAPTSKHRRSRRGRHASTCLHQTLTSREHAGSFGRTDPPKPASLQHHGGSCRSCLGNPSRFNQCWTRFEIGDLDIIHPAIGS